MIKTARLAPPNSLIIIEDSFGGEIPSSLNNGLLSFTASAIAIGCKCEFDGETNIKVMESSGNIAHPVVFDGKLKTPSKRLSIRTVLGESILEAQVPSEESTVKISANDLLEPDEIFIILLTG
ncbi:hypothetical protein [Zavarzinia aquatilis]|uniref:Uncharacterized protein n=1 Tax=Zavarzinia aquatilis TaxID=2211142 RepID=A0A317EDC1_9PROT|nr:hypothetical protein [Zavarzinia aquatilis]PWR24266.1 hypothetical protein DKG74_09110 [Zavarzinia aquatilis]